MDNRLLFKYISIFGDDKEHTFNEIKYLGYNVCGRNTKLSEEYFNYFLRCNRIKKTCYGNKENSNYKLSSNGDGWMRDMAVRLGGSAGYYRNMNRSPESYNKFGNS